MQKADVYKLLEVFQKSVILKKRQFHTQFHSSGRVQDILIKRVKALYIPLTGYTLEQEIFTPHYTGATQIELNLSQHYKIVDWNIKQLTQRHWLLFSNKQEHPT